MINKLSIRNFKSIRELDLDCRRVNVFIGEPNAGKTNILEALGMRSKGVLAHFREALRVSAVADLFWDQDITGRLVVTLNESPLFLKFEAEEVVAVLNQAVGSGHQAYRMSKELNVIPETIGLNDQRFPDIVRYYLFKNLLTFDASQLRFLAPPFGDNLFDLLYSSKEARSTASRFFQSSGFKLNVDVSERRIALAKQVDDFLISLPYHSCSETLRRMVFYSLALDTSSEHVLVFDEPEAHSFPPYTKTLAERIALDDRGNQFFLTTHSPYMLDSLLSKTPANDLSVILCRMENFETKTYPLDQEQIDQIKEWSMDAFFNFDRLLPEVK
ncbi:AAA family ATPase [Brevifollis gellanilyticus]|nr:AAA family ATPase [Brevifollis gellanilyticus]